MSSAKYKGQTIDVRSLPRPDGYGWSARIFIEKHMGDVVDVSRPHDLETTYLSEEEALEAGLEHGKNIIDGI
jgi:hypothetical protein